MDSQTVPTSDESSAQVGPPLRRIAIWVFAGVAAVFAVLLVPIPFKGRISVAIGDLCHAPLFFAIATGALLALQAVWPLKDNSSKLIVRCLTLLVALAMFGALMEWLQHHFGRSASVHDAIANTLGASAATAWYLRRRISSRAIAHSLGATACLLMLFAWYRPVLILHDVWKVRNEYPIICSFETELELTRWYLRGCRIELSDRDVTHGNHAAQIRFSDQQYPAATLNDFPTDWSDAAAFELDVVLDDEFPGESVTLMVKVVDRIRETDHTDTFHTTRTLFPGKRETIRVTRDEMLAGPVFHPLDLPDLQYVDLGLIRPTAPAVIRVDHLRVTASSSE